MVSGSIKSIGHASEVLLVPGMRAELHRVTGPHGTFRLLLVVGFDPRGPRGGRSGRWVEGDCVFDEVLSVPVVLRAKTIYRDLLARIAHLDEQWDSVKVWAAEQAMEVDADLRRIAG